MPAVKPAPATFTTRPEIRGHFGVVTSTHWLASATGMAVLEKGGNAFDAAVACGMVLQVAEPHLVGPGGELPAILWSAREKKVRVLCGQGPAPKLATQAHFKKLGLDKVPGAGHLPVVVPGAFDGWMTLLADYGTFKLRDIMSYAILYAEEGIPVLAKMAAAINTMAPVFRDEWTGNGQLYLKDGKGPKVGELHKNPDLGRLYRRILDNAEKASGDRIKQIENARAQWYRGWLAEAIDKFSRTAVLDTTGERNVGLLRADDLASYRATYEEPLTTTYGDLTVCKMSFWSQGPAMLQQINMLEKMDVGSMPIDGPDFVHTLTEVTKLAMADRDAWFGDPKFFDIPGAALISKAYADERRKLVSGKASMDLRPGAPGGRKPDFDHILNLDTSPGPMGFMVLGEPSQIPDIRPGDTVHFDIIDKDGNFISATPSGAWLSSTPVIPGLGICLSSRGQQFFMHESSPNAIGPGKRPRITLSPTMALRGGEPWLIWGTPGGDQQDQWITQVFMRIVEHGLNLQQAIDAPAFHSEHFPNSFYPHGRKPGRLVVESRFPEATIAELKRRGHDIVVNEAWSEGRITAAAREGKLLKAAANPRLMQNYAIGR